MMPSWDMMQACSPNVAPQTTAAIIQVESGGNPFAIGVNGPIKNRLQPKNTQQAAIVARYYLLQGHTVDLGLMQINSSNLPGLGYTLEQMFDPCINMQAGGRILSRGYHGAIKRHGEGQNALNAALSAYNTGNYERGFRNGYVAQYYRGAPVRVVASYSTQQSFGAGKNAATTTPSFHSNSSTNQYSLQTTIYRAPQDLFPAMNQEMK